MSKTWKRGKLVYALTIQTRAYPCLTLCYVYSWQCKSGTYNNYDLLTPIALAHWIMGDDVARNEGLTLCTESFILP